jgi:tripartite-type tricarboxylate transporter receptor subunit TctC
MKPNVPMRIFMAMLLSFAMAGALAQAWPARPIQIIAPAPPGSTPDIVTRILAHKLSEQLGQQVITVNRPGANGNIASEFVAKAAPDGYTILLGSIVNTVNPHIMKLAIALDDLAPVSSVAAAPDILLVNPSVPATTMRELIAWLKSKPSTPIAHPGLGSTPHLSAVFLQSMAGVDLTLVPYAGGNASLVALMGNHVPVGFVTSVVSVPPVRAGQLRAIGISSAKRISGMPDLPTLGESGLPGFDVTAWFGVFAPPKTPRAIIDRLSEEIRKAVTSDDVRKRLVELGAEPLGSSSADDFAAFVKADSAKWGKVVKDIGIRPE